MKTRFRVALSLLLTFIVAFVVVAPVQAQGGECPMAQEDCDLLEAGLASLGDLQSVNVSSLNLVVFVEAEGTAEQFSLTGSGPLAIVGDTLETDMTLNLTSESEDMEGPDSVRLIVKDGTTYTQNLDSGEWEVESVDDMDTSDLEELGGMAEDISMDDLEALLGGLMGMEGVVTLERGDDVDMDGTSVALFHLNMALGQLVQSDDFINVLIEGLVTSGAGEDLGMGELTEEDAEFLSFLLSSLLAELGDQLDAGETSITVMVGAEDQQIYGLAITFDQEIDLSFLGALTGETTEPMAPITLLFDFDMSWDQHNQDVTIEVPAEAMDAMQ
jgi:hypothetical protein